MTSDVEQILATAALVNDLVGNSSDAMGLYLTVIRAYLLVAYLVVKELTFLQTMIITTLFVFFTSLNNIATITYMNNAHFFGSTYGAGRMPGWASPVVGVCLFSGILAAVKFIWDVRHPKQE